MADIKKIQTIFKKLYGIIKSAKDISEEDLRVEFVKSGILKELGYKGELEDIRFEKGIKGKRSDLLAFDDYKNVNFVVEFKKALDLEQDFVQLWERYVKPLKARYGVLTDGQELVIYERVNSNSELKIRLNLSEVTLSQCEEISAWLKKPKIERTRINEVLSYFERFDKPEERVNLSTEISQQYFFDSFELKGDSIFVNLVQKTIGLFDFELERSMFLKCAYNFWKISYAKKPDKVPENWQRIMDHIGLEATEENLLKFMFCLESAYSLFTRLILAKACEDYKLPYVEFSKFIKTEIERTSYRGDITLLAWAITTKNLIESMKQKLVKSVFEGDIFYWWEDSYSELKPGAALYSPQYEKQKARFGEALAEIILTLYKFDFSEIVGDPLGTLYQHYFDKETRKALGEFYTPKEVVEYILDAVGYEGRGVIGKRLLDPACGSGTFLVEALRRYLKASEEIAEEKGWPAILKELCDEFCIAGFDIHPFATFMAQMQFMLVLIPAYKKAMDEDPHFVLNRLPIFRTDSLVDETKGEAMKVTIETFESGIRYILVDTSLPVEGGNLKIKMPYYKDVFARTDLLNVQEYFAALQAVFDTVKESAWQEKYVVDKEKLERNFKLYLEDKDWNNLVSFFIAYAEHFLLKFKELKETFGDGKLIKSVEDLMLAAILKNYVKYDFVVGNPPYVRVHRLEKDAKRQYEEVYRSATGRYDLYVLFTERGVTWLNNDGNLGYIISSMFTNRGYGKELRGFLSQQTSVREFIDFGISGVFPDLANYPCILSLTLGQDKKSKIKCVRVAPHPTTNVISEIRENIEREEYTSESIDIFAIEQSELSSENWVFIPEKERQVFYKIKVNNPPLKTFYKNRAPIKTNKDEVFIVDEEDVSKYKLENEILKPKIKGKEEIDKWNLKWDGKYVIYPYVLKNGKTSLVNIDDYPNVKKYLQDNISTLEIRNKERYFKDSGKEWFELWNQRNPEWYENPKIIYAEISPTNCFVLDHEKFYCVGKSYTLLLGVSEDRNRHIYLNAILNSKGLEFYFKHIAPIKQGRSYEYIKGVENLPIHFPQTKSEEVLADEITKKVEQILENVKIEQKIENFPDEYIQEYRSRGEEFDSTSITFKSNHKALEPVIEEETTSIGYNIVFGKKEKPVFVDSTAKADYVVTALKGTRAKKDEKKQVLIPKSDAIVEEILKKLESDKAQIKSPSVAELEDAINGLVYTLYGLNENDVEVIDEFLRRF